jgi:hypothetical protein
MTPMGREEACQTVVDLLWAMRSQVCLARNSTVDCNVKLTIRPHNTQATLGCKLDVDDLESVDSGDDTIRTRADMDSRNRDPRASRKSLSYQKGTPKRGQS